ncbi:MAG: DUF167 domain-containing protein [Promethearchaeota archaeon]
MGYIEKQTDKSYFLHLNVKPNSKKFNIVENGNTLTIYLLSKPIKNQANKELINKLRKILDIPATQVQIVSGLRSNNKIIKLDFIKKISVEAIIKKLTN